MSDPVVLCTDDERVRDALVKAGYEPVPPAENFDRHRLVVVGPGTDPEVTAYLRSLAGDVRRALVVVAVGDDFATGDRAQAWRASVDLVVHPDQLAELDDRILETAREKTDFYTRLRHVAQGQGDL